MGYIDRSKLQMPEFCEGCPAIKDMDEPELVIGGRVLHDPLTTWIGPLGEPDDRLILIRDKSNTEAEPYVIGADEGCPDPFCGEHEYAESRVIGEACDNALTCDGPYETRSFLLRKRLNCDAGAVALSRWRQGDDRGEFTSEQADEARVLVDPTN